MPSNNHLKPNQILYNARKAKGLTQQALAEKIYVTLKTVQRWERGESFPRRFELASLCQFFEKTAEELGFVKENTALETEDTVSQTQIDVQQRTPDDASQQIAYFLPEQQIAQQTIEESTMQQREDNPHQVEQSATDQRDRRLLFNLLDKRYKDELEERLSGKDFIPLRLHECFLIHPRSRQYQHIKRRERPLLAGTTIDEVYDRVTRGLLILGKAGAGKTTLLYQLASALLERAEQDESILVPIVLNLSNWSQEQKSLSDWAVKELEVAYNIPRKLGQRWLEGRFQLFLDGLDEVSAAVRSACIEVINAYHQESLISFVVCSREEEYIYSQDCASLAVQSTIIVQSLTSEQVDTYLVDPSLTAMREEARTNTVFCDLLQTPLMLNTAVTLYEGKASEHIPKEHTTVTLMKQQIFSYYVEQRLLGLEEQARIRMRRQLQWLAEQLQQNDLNTFYLEQIQANWLPGGLRWLYIWLGVRLPGILLGFLLTCLVNNFFLHDSPADLLVHSIPGAIVGGLLSTRYISQSGLGQLQKTSSSLSTLRNAILLGGAFAAIIISIDLSTNSRYSFFGGLILGTWLLVVTLVLPAKQPSSQRNHHLTLRLTSYLQHSISIANPWYDSMLIALLSGISWGLIRTITDGPTEGISTAMTFALIYALSSILTSSILITQAMKVSPVEMIELSLGKFLRSLINRKHLHTTVLVGIGTCLLVGLDYGLSYGSRDGLSYGLTYGGCFGLGYALGAAVNYWFLVGFFQGLSRDTMPDQEESTIPNNGIRRSARNGWYLGLTSGIISASIASIITMLILWLIDIFIRKYGLPIAKPNAMLVDWGMTTGLVTLIAIGVVTGLVKGGIVWWRHWILRFLLWSDRLIPWNYADLVEEACRYNLLRKEGKEGYRFFHSLFQDYFASLPTDEDQTIASK